MADPVLIQAPKPQQGVETAPPIVAPQPVKTPAPQPAATPTVQAPTPTPQPPAETSLVQAPGPAMGVSVEPPKPIQTPDQQAAIAASQGKAAAGASAAAGAKGKQGESASASAANTASDTAAKPAAAKPAQAGGKSPVQQVADLGGEAVKIAERILKGDDPVAAQELNSLVMTQGPRNQAMMQSLALRLRQSGLDGQGAGNALLGILAAGNEYNNGVLMAQIGERSAARLMEMTQWGLDKSMAIWEKREAQKREDLKFLLSNGQYDSARGLWDDIYPGVPLDVSAIQSASPVRKEAFTARMKGVDQLISQGNADGAKAAMLALAQEMPEMFGFKDAASAVAAVQAMDFTTEAFLAKGDNIRAVQGLARNAALAGDATALGTAVDQEFNLKGAPAIEAIANSALKSMSLEDLNSTLEAAGLTPVQSMDEAAMLDKRTLAKAVEMQRYAKDSRVNAVDTLFKDFTRLQPAIALDPNASRAAKAWIAANVYQLASNPDGTVSIGSGAEIQPWSENAPTAHYFMDWPKATFSEEHGAKTIYEGGVPYDEGNKPGDLTTPTGQEDARLDGLWWEYVMNTPADKRLSMKEWYYATAGGNGPVVVERIPAGIRQVKPEPPKLDPPGDPKPDPKDADFYQEIPRFSSAAAIESWANQRGSRTVNIAGTPADVTGLKEYDAERNARALVLTVGGKQILYDVGRETFLVLNGTGGSRYSSSKYRTYPTFAEAKAGAGV